MAPGCRSPGRDAALGQVHAEMLCGVLESVDRALGRGLIAAFGSRPRQSACPSRRPARVPDMHRVRVHDPGHGLRCGVDIRSGDVLLGPMMMLISVA